METPKKSDSDTKTQPIQLMYKPFKWFKVDKNTQKLSLSKVFIRIT